MSVPTHAQASRVLWWLVGTAFVISVIHYLDNYVNYDDYPLPPAGSDLPAPSQDEVLRGWVLFTAAGVLGVWLWRRRRITAAALALLGYSLSGLIGVGHYAVPGAVDMVWWRQAHVVADIAAGLAVAAFAGWAFRHRRELGDGRLRQE